MINIIDNAEWASQETKNELRKKVRLLNFQYGKYDFIDIMAGAEIGETSVDTAISFMKSHRNSNKRFLRDEGMKLSNESDLYTFNAFYQYDGNAIVICDGIYECWNSFDENASYEEKLGFLGSILAHEAAHSLDSRNACYDSDGLYYEAFDSQWDSFNNMRKPILDSLDGKKTEYGNLIQADKVCDETYCDLLAMKCCFKLLENIEDADYDKFFKGFAKSYAQNINKEYDRFLCRQDTHITNNERVNYVLSMFDEFYETYDIDENSSYYVPAQDRVKLY